jgi:mxaC protein
MSFDHPWVLPGLLLCVPALAGGTVRWMKVSSVGPLPRDWLSSLVDIVLRLLPAAAIAAAVFGLAGLHRGAGSVERTGRGAHIVLLLDRSLSMDEGLALTGEKARMTKTAAAADLIEAFFARRPNDAFGLVAFSTQPIPVMPLTEHRDAIAAAMAAMRQKGLANTDIGAGFLAALKLFDGDDPAASRVVLFVSDGAGHIADAVQADLRTRMLLERIHLYYLYLRSGDSPPLSAEGAAHNDLSQPAALDSFFRSLGIPYRGFEASDPDAVVAAVDEVGRLENRQVMFHETVPRIGFEGLCYGLAAGCLLLTLLARLAECDFPAPRRRA